MSEGNFISLPLTSITLRTFTHKALDIHAAFCLQPVSLPLVMTLKSSTFTFHSTEGDVVQNSDHHTQMACNRYVSAPDS